MSAKRSRQLLFFQTLRPVYLGAVVLALAVLFWDLAWPVPPDALLSASLTVSSVVIGFLISALAIITSSNSRTMERVRQMGLLIELTDAFALAIYLAGAFALLNVCGFFGWSGRVFAAFWIATGVAMLYSFQMLCSLLLRLVRD